MLPLSALVSEFPQWPWSSVSAGDVVLLSAAPPEPQPPPCLLWFKSSHRMGLVQTSYWASVFLRTRLWLPTGSVTALLLMKVTCGPSVISKPLWSHPSLTSSPAPWPPSFVCGMWSPAFPQTPPPHPRAFSTPGMFALHKATHCPSLSLALHLSHRAFPAARSKTVTLPSGHSTHALGALGWPCAPRMHASPPRFLRTSAPAPVGFVSSTGVSLVPGIASGVE